MRYEQHTAAPSSPGNNLMLSAKVRETAGRISRQKSFACCFVIPAVSIHIRIGVSSRPSLGVSVTL
jgi:hypothetical protein